MSASRLFLFVFLLILASVAAFGQQLIATVPVGPRPANIAVNPVTNKIYVTNLSSDTVSVIDGTTNMVTETVIVGDRPDPVAINPVTNKIYVGNISGNTVTVIDGATNATATVAAGAFPWIIAVNPLTNRIYVANANSHNVTVIDGATNSTVTVGTGELPQALAVNRVTNQIYVANADTDNVTVIDGASNSTATVPSGRFPHSIAVNPLTNRIYVATNDDVTVIDGASNHTTAVNIGTSPGDIAVNSITNKIYVTTKGASPGATVINGVDLSFSSVLLRGLPSKVAVDVVTNKVYVTNEDGVLDFFDGLTLIPGAIAIGSEPTGMAIDSTTNMVYAVNFGDNTVSVIAGATAPMQFVTVTPCRVADTRKENGTFGGPAIRGRTSRAFPIPRSTCHIPAAAAAYSLNVTVVPHGRLGYLTLWPAGLDQPLVSTLNSFDGRVKANAAIVPAGANGAVSVFAADTTDVVLDINGYFLPADYRTLLMFHPLPPCRVADTRQSLGPLGGPNLHGNTAREFPVLRSACNIPSTAQAYSLNFTSVPRGRLGYLSVWPTGQSQPLVSTLNAPTGQITANAALVPAGAGGDIEVLATDDSDLVIDVNGYFSLPVNGPGLSLYATEPCRVLDTRREQGVFSESRVVDVASSSCAIPLTAQGYVMNATVLPSVRLGYLTLWPDGGQRPVVSTLNAPDGMVTSNMAIVPTNNGSIDAFATDLTQLIVDISGYFAQ